MKYLVKTLSAWTTFEDLINGFVVLTGKELNEILEESYKEHMESKNES